MRRKKYYKCIDEWFKRHSHNYVYYDYPSCVNYFEEALEHERNYRLNCSDFEKDLSAEATNRRIINDIEKMRNNNKNRRYKMTNLDDLTLTELVKLATKKIEENNEDE